MNAIDYSSKHDILIRHHDGVLRPMDEPHYEVNEIAPGTWQILSSGDYHYLLAGDGEAIAIDTGYGAGDLREFLESVAGMSVRYVINTHDHFDHTALNSYFDGVYCGEASVSRLTTPFPSFAGLEFPKNPNVTVVKEGDIIPLPGRPLEVFQIADHAPGSIALLDKKTRILFTGDEFMDKFKRIGESVEKLRDDMARLMERRGEFDRLCGGPGIFEAEFVNICHEAAERILAGQPGEPAPAQGDGFLPLEVEMLDGHMVFDWKRPRPMDINGGKGLPKPGPDAAVYFWRGCRFTYSTERIWKK